MCPFVARMPPAASVASLLLRRETRGPRAFAGGVRGPFSSIGADFQLPWQQLVRESGAPHLLLAAVLLCYSRCGRFLLTYTYSDSLSA